MQQQTLLPLKPKFPTPCKRLLRQLKLPYKMSITTALRFRHLRRAAHKKTTHRRRTRPFLPFLCRSASVRSAEMDEVGELVSMAETARSAPAAPFPSPLTPAYARLRRAAARDVDVEEACRSFENYLVEMIVEEGEVRDLVDVEELLHCWDYLRDPAFVELVSRFYGELCRDLFWEHGDELVE